MASQLDHLETKLDARSLVMRALSLHVALYRELETLSADERKQPSPHGKNLNTIVALWHQAFGAVEDIDGYLFHWPALQHSAGNRLDKEQYVLLAMYGNGSLSGWRRRIIQSALSVTVSVIRLFT